MNIYTPFFNYRKISSETIDRLLILCNMPTSRINYSERREHIAADTWARIWWEIASRKLPCISEGNLFLFVQTDVYKKKVAITKMCKIKFNCKFWKIEVTYFMSGGRRGRTLCMQKFRYPAAFSNKSTASLMQPENYIGCDNHHRITVIIVRYHNS